MVLITSNTLTEFILKIDALGPDSHLGYFAMLIKVGYFEQALDFLELPYFEPKDDYIMGLLGGMVFSIEVIEDVFDSRPFYGYPMPTPAKHAGRTYACENRSK